MNNRGPSHLVLHAVAEKQIAKGGTAFHCCLEFYSVATRLPPEFRLTPADAAQLIEEKIAGRMTVHDLPLQDQPAFWTLAAREGTAGGRVYDVHIAEVARAAGAKVIVTDNRRHFSAALRYGIRVETPAEFAATLKRPRRGSPPLGRG